jgi:hypothetical protein
LNQHGRVATTPDFFNTISGNETFGQTRTSGEIAPDSGHSRSNSARSLAPQPEGRPGEQITLDDVEHIAI